MMSRAQRSSASSHSAAAPSVRYFWLLAVMSTALLVGCTTNTTVTQSLGDTKDLVTASDETNGSKRARLRMELAAGYFGRGQMTTALDQVKLALQADPTLGEAYNLR